jgi:V-type H+-transporting ATPase subunit C
LEKLVLTGVQELNTVDNDVKSKFNQYNTVKTNLAQLQRRQT